MISFGIENNQPRFVLLILLPIVLAWTLCPFVEESVNRIILFAIIPLILRCINNKIKIAYYNYSSLFSFVVIWVAWQFLLKLIGHSNSSWGSHSDTLLFYVFLYLSFRLRMVLSIKSKLFVCIVSAAILAGTVFLYYRKFVNGELQVTWADSDSGMELELIPTIFKMVLMFHAMSMVLVLFFAEKYIVKIFALILISLSVFIIYVIGNNATATLLFIVFTIAAGLMYIKKDRWKRHMFKGSQLMVTGCIIILLSSLFGEYIFSFLASATEDVNPQTAVKLQAIADLIGGKTKVGLVSGNSLLQRLFLMKVSLNTWTQDVLTFLIGVGRDDGFFEVSHIGRHSEFIDCLAMYGIFGGIFNFVIFYKLHKILCQGWNVLTINFFTLFYTMLILMGFLNNIIYPFIASIIFIFCVFIFDIINHYISSLIKI